MVFDRKHLCLQSSSPSAGTGRQAWLRAMCPYGREGSSPSLGTIYNKSIFFMLLFFLLAQMLVVLDTQILFQLLFSFLFRPHFRCIKPYLAQNRSYFKSINDLDCPSLLAKPLHLYIILAFNTFYRPFNLSNFRVV